jgi:hypothetical protein
VNKPSVKYPVGTGRYLEGSYWNFFTRQNHTFLLGAKKGPGLRQNHSVRFLIFANPGKITRRVDNFHMPQTTCLRPHASATTRHNANTTPQTMADGHQNHCITTNKTILCQETVVAIFWCDISGRCTYKIVTKNIEGNMEENLVDLESKSRRLLSFDIFCDIFWWRHMTSQTKYRRKYWRKKLLTEWLLPTKKLARSRFANVSELRRREPIGGGTLLNSATPCLTVWP